MGTDGTGVRDLGAVVHGLDGFRLIAVDEHDGELELAVETTADVVGCPGCGRSPPGTGVDRCGCGTCRSADGRPR